LPNQRSRSRLSRKKKVERRIIYLVAIKKPQGQARREELFTLWLSRSPKAKQKYNLPQFSPELPKY
jgi:hypothetical protein